MTSKFNFSRFFGTDYDEGEYQESSHNGDNSKVIPITGREHSLQNSKIAVFEPKIYADVKVIAKQLIDNNAVIINFDVASDESTRRIIDFLNGVIFTIDGNIERISELVFLFAPHNYHINGDIKKSINDRIR